MFLDDKCEGNRNPHQTFSMSTATDVNMKRFDCENHGLLARLLLHGRYGDILVVEILF